MIKNIIKQVFGALGLSNNKKKKKNNRLKENSYQIGQYEALMLGLLSSLRFINIVQIGANDGATSDPIYEFLMKYKHFTKVLLVEPQEEIIPYLENNYSGHPYKYIFNVAIGHNDTLTLYRIKKDFRHYFKPHYAEDWPDYRAATGITSFNEEHVMRWAKKHSTGELQNIDQAIETIQVPCMDLKLLLNQVKFDQRVDILQIDAEGADDQVIYSCSIDSYKPKIINYESANLSTDNSKKLEVYLEDKGYTIFNHGKLNRFAVNLPTSNEKIEDISL